LRGGIALAMRHGMKRKLTSNLIVAGWLLGATGGLVLAAPQAPDQSQPTADQQKSNKADRTLTQKIRRAIVSDKSLSVAANDVTVVSQDGMVTLRGTVKSDDEKKAVEDKATEIAGQGKVTSELTVSSSDSK
jgi:hyperosmotically inducible periplasmic protein